MFTQNENGTLTHKATGQVLEAMAPYALMEAVRAFHNQKENDALIIAQLMEDLKAATSVKKDTLDHLPSMNMPVFPLGGRFTGFTPPFPYNG